MHSKLGKGGKEALKAMKLILEGVSVYETKAGKWVEVIEGMVQHHSSDKAMAGLRSLDSLLNCPKHELRTDPMAINGPVSRVKKKYVGVRQRKSGQWTAEIRLGKNKCYLGTFKTTEEAATAYTRARIEYNSKKRKQEVDHEEANKRLKKGNVKWKPRFKRVVELDSDHIEAGNAHYQNSQFEGHSLVMPKRDFRGQDDCHLVKKLETSLENKNPDLTSEAENLVVTMDSSHESKGSQASVENWEIPGLSSAGDKEDSCTEVINHYGQLIGEYSRLDDELWFCRLEEDDVGYGDCTMGCFEDLAWDLKPSTCGTCR